MLLQVGRLTKTFGADIVLEDLAMRIERGEKVALVGRNGAGKSTLIKILIGEIEADAGTVAWERGAEVGYLSQHSALDPNATVIEVAQTARAHLLELERRLKELETKLESSANPDDLDEYSLLAEHFHHEGGYSIERDLDSVLGRLGFRPEDYSKPVRVLSGGEKTRLTLAKLLLEEPDLLILDEPTNHLDLEAIEWLESWIKGYGGAVLLVSHDRTFLNAVAERVLDLRDRTVKSYPGPFEKFLQLRREDDIRQARVAELQQKEIDKLDEYVRRFMGSERTAQARGRLKHLEKMRAAAVQAPSKEKSIKADFGKAARSGDLVLEAEGLEVGIGNLTLVRGFDWLVRRGERWALIGANGAGKSTLLRVLMGELESQGGRFRLGSKVQPGFFRQDARDLPLDQSPCTILNNRYGLTFGQAKSLLGRFLLSGDDAERPVSTLSGGERVKVALAALTAESPNLLVLDEPTNHLDVDSREALAEVLLEFDGTLVLVSHDRWLLNEVTDRTLDLRRSGPVFFDGPYAAYRASRERPAPVATAKDSEAPKPTLSPREVSKAIGRLTKEVDERESAVTGLEQELSELESKMAAPSPTDDIVAMSHRHGALQSEIAAAMSAWEQAVEELENLKSLQG